MKIYRLIIRILGSLALIGYYNINSLVWNTLGISFLGMGGW